MTKTKTFAVVGGGIAGLTLAIALQKKGILVQVFEKAPEIKPVGAGIVLAANAMKAFRSIGIEKEVLAAGKEMKRFCINDHKGRLLSSTEANKISSKYGLTNTVTLHRADLHEVLLNNLEKNTLHLDKGCIDFVQDGTRLKLIFKDSSTFTADYVIAADGIHSVFRKKLLPASKPRYSGYTCWRGVATGLPQGFSMEEAFESWGPGKRFGIVPLTRNRVYWYATLDAPENDATLNALDVAGLMDAFRDFHDPVKTIIEKTSPDQLIKNDIIDIEPIKQFAFGAITLSGDAAHATTPNLGQGACMAIEDAVVLANCISAHSDTELAFRYYEQKRIGRTTKIVNASYQLGKVGQWKNPLLVKFRNAAMKYTPEMIADKQLEFLFNVSLP